METTKTFKLGNLLGKGIKAVASGAVTVTQASLEGSKNLVAGVKAGVASAKETKAEEA